MFIQKVNLSSLRNALEFASQYVEISYNIYAIWLMNTPHISIVFGVYNCRWQSIRVLDHFCFDDGILSRLIRIAKIWSACKLARDLTKTIVNYILGWSISYNKSSGERKEIKVNRQVFFRTSSTRLDSTNNKQIHLSKIIYTTKSSISLVLSS